MHDSRATAGVTDDENRLADGDAAEAAEKDFVHEKKESSKCLSEGRKNEKKKTDQEVTVLTGWATTASDERSQREPGIDPPVKKQEHPLFFNDLLRNL